MYQLFYIVYVVEHDIEGMLKYLGIEICIPLRHLRKSSLTTSNTKTNTLQRPIIDRARYRRKIKLYGWNFMKDD
jgi:hypothetical protein